MADDSVKYVKTARVLAIVHIIVGFLLFCFGIADRVVGNSWTGSIYFGIWIGIWMIIAGGLGIPGTRKEQSTPRTTFAGIFMGFAIVSAVLGGIIIIVYSISNSLYHLYKYNYRYGYRKEYETEMAITAIILILGIVEFAIGIAASVCLCLTKPFNCCYSTPFQQQQAMYTANTGYVVTQGPVGPAVAIPMQAAGGMVAVQTVTPDAQEDHPQMVMVPVSEAGVYQPQLAQAVPAKVLATGCQPQLVQVAPAGYQSQQAEMPPLYEHGQYMTQQNAKQVKNRRLLLHGLVN